MKKRTRKNLVLAAVLLFALILSACGSEAKPSSSQLSSSAAQSSDSVSTSQGEAAEAKSLTIIHVNDIHGNVDQTETAIGYPKISQFIDDMKAEDPNTLAFDAGDTFAGTPNAAFDKGTSVAELLATVNFDAMTAGNNDFYLGTQQLKSFAAVLNYPMLAGNVTEGGNAFMETTAYFEMENGLRVGVVSATCGHDDNLTFEDPIASLQAQVDELRDKSDIVIALLHIGMAEGDEFTSVRVAKEVEGIDVIIDGHSHTVLESGQEENGVLIAQTGEYGSNIGLVKIEFAPDKTIKATASLVGNEEMGGKNEKAETTAALNVLLGKSNEFFSQVVGQTLEILDGSRDTIRTKESNMGNLFADAVCYGTEADIAMCIAGTIGGEIDAGDITKGDILAIARVSTSYSVYELSGKEVIDELQTHCNVYPESSGSFVQVSGISFSIDPSQPENERVHSVMVDGKPIDLEKNYNVALLGYSKDAVKSGFPPSEEIIEDYIAAHSPVSPKAEGRITEGPKA